MAKTKKQTARFLVWIYRRDPETKKTTVLEKKYCNDGLSAIYWSKHFAGTPENQKISLLSPRRIWSFTENIKRKRERAELNEQI